MNADTNETHDQAVTEQVDAARALIGAYGAYLMELGQSMYSRACSEQAEKALQAERNLIALHRRTSQVARALALVQCESGGFEDCMKDLEKREQEISYHLGRLQEFFRKESPYGESTQFFPSWLGLQIANTRECNQ